MDEVLEWLLAGDPAIGWQVQRDLTDGDWQGTRLRVASEGWGSQILSHRRADGTWPTGWYSPKWTSTFYSLQVLQQLGVPAPESVRALLGQGLRPDGTFLPWSSGREDVCVRAMMLTMATGAAVAMPGAVERLLADQLPDGGWNCQRQATHASFHTTISTLEALAPFESTQSEVAHAAAAGREFLLAHRLFRSHRTGEVARESFTRFSFPHYWYYDVLRALEYWRAFAWDPRLDEAVGLVARKRRAGRWTLQGTHPGQTWVDMERAGAPSRWNTLRALRVLAWADRASAASGWERRHRETSMKGWDFARLDGRMSAEDPPWDFEAICAAAMADRDGPVLDLGTGGGERLAELGEALGSRRPARVTATEGWAPNLAVARRRLAPLGIEVVPYDSQTQPRMPFPDRALSLVMARHESYDPAEIARILAPGGVFLTQQVDGRDCPELSTWFGRPPEYPQVRLEPFREALAAGGLVIGRSAHWQGAMVLEDVDALVEYLALVPWAVPGFQVADHVPTLQRLQDGAPIRLTLRRFWIEARRPR